MVSKIAPVFYLSLCRPSHKKYRDLKWFNSFCISYHIIQIQNLRMTRPSFQMSLVQSMNKDWPQHCVYDLTWSLYNGLTTISNLQCQTTRDIREENCDRDTILGRRGMQASSRLENGKKGVLGKFNKGEGEWQIGNNGMVENVESAVCQEYQGHPRGKANCEHLFYGLIFRCACISWFQVVTEWVINYFCMSEDVWNKNSFILVWFYICLCFLLIWNIKAFQTYNFTFIARTWTFTWKMTWKPKFGEIFGLVF